MLDYVPAEEKPEFRIPVWIFTGLLVIAIGIILWGNSGDLVDSIVRPDFLISEIQPANWTTLADSDGEFPDWIEIHNPSAESRELTGWYLTDDFKELSKWRFPEITLEGGGFLVVFASGKNRSQFLDDLHTNFRLDERGEYLALVEPSGRRVMHEFLPKYPPVSGDDSLGIRARFFQSAQSRRPGAHRATAFYDRATPGMPNVNEIWGQVSDTHFSRNGGWIEAPFELELDTSTLRTRIRYTLDGSEPTEENGIVYQRPLVIDRTTTIRVRAFRANYKPSNVDTQSYFFPGNLVSQRGSGLPETWGMKGDWAVPADYEMDLDVIQDERNRSALGEASRVFPSVSLVVDPADLFDRQRGIYANPEAVGRDWERPASVEFHDGSGSKRHREECGVRIFGHWDRRPEESPKHGLRLVFRDQYGAAELRHRVFGKEGPKRVRNLVFKPGYHDSWLHWDATVRSRGTLLRDEWVRRTSKAVGLTTPRGRYVHLYLNGLYWGIYLMGTYSDGEFLAEELGGNAIDYETRSDRGGLSGEELAWQELMKILESDVRTGSQYEAVEARLDLDRFIDFLLVQLYSGGGRNDQRFEWYAWRRVHPTGKFSFMVWNGDRALSDPSSDLGDVSLDSVPVRWLHRLRVNESFQARFRERARMLLGEGGALSLGANRGRLKALEGLLEKAVVLEAARWGDYRRDIHPFRAGPYVLYDPNDDWKQAVDWIDQVFFEQRQDELVRQLERLGLW